MKFRDKVKIAAINAYERALSEGISGSELAVFMFIQGIIFAKTGKSIESVEDNIKKLLKKDDYEFEIEDCKYDYIDDNEKEKI